MDNPQQQLYEEFEIDESSSCESSSNETFLPKRFQQLQNIEEQILSIHHLEVGRDIEIKNIKINLNGTDDDWIHTYISIDKGKERKRTEKQPLVLIHGYGGGSILFQKIFKKLSKEFKVYCFDIIGLNLSSRPNVDHLKTVEDIIGFFVNSIQQWVKEVGLQDTPFYLAGHSFGGYLASFYCKHNQDQVKKLVLISPAGISKISKQENDSYDQNRYINMKLKEKMLHWFRKCVWKYQITYEYLYSTFFFLPKQYIMKKMISSRLKAKTVKEQQLWQDFYNGVLSLPESTSRFVYSLFFYPRVVAHMPVEDIFQQEMKVPVTFLYGQHDWMNREGAYRLSQTNNNIFNIQIVSSSGHHINIDNPEELSHSIIDNILRIDDQ